MAEATTPVTKRRRPWLAALANVFAAPMGHVYAGRPLRGVVAYVLNLGLGLAALWVSLSAASGAWLIACVAALCGGYAAVAADAYLVARRVGASYQLASFNRWYVYLLGTAILLVGGAGEQDTFRRELVQAYKIPSGAMIPTVLIGDHILVNKRVYRSGPPQRFDVAVFEYPQDPAKDYVKRIIGLPGDKIEVRDKVVWLNGSPLEEPYVEYAEGREGRKVSGRDNFGPFEIPPDHYFFMGDNRDRSYDSRFWGPVAREKIKGRVQVVYWSWIPTEWLVRWNRIGTAVR